MLIRKRYEVEYCLKNHMSHLKVALFTGNYNHIRDGVSLTLNRWVRFLLDHEVDVKIFAPSVDEPDVDHAGDLSVVPSIPAPVRPEYRITTGLPQKNLQELDQFNPDLVHIATPDILGYKALKWALGKNVPVVSSYHTHFTSYLKYYKLAFIEPLGWKYLRWFYSHCEQVYVPTQSMADELRAKHIGRNESSLKIWARGVDTNLFNPGNRESKWREMHGFAPDDVVITFVSRLVWEKNLKLFADVVNRLQENYSNVQSMVVGDGPAKEEMQQLMPDTEFTGFLTGINLAKAYACSDVFFFPSDTETFGNVTLEAMASGLPCLVADAAGSKSLIEHGKNGYLVPVEEDETFYQCAEKMVNDPALRERMAGESLSRSRDFTWQKINSGLLENYRQVTGKTAEL